MGSRHPDEFAMGDEAPDDVLVNFPPFGSQSRIGCGAFLHSVFDLLLDGIGVGNDVVEPSDEAERFGRSGFHDLIFWSESTLKA